MSGYLMVNKSVVDVKIETGSHTLTVETKPVSIEVNCP